MTTVTLDWTGSGCLNVFMLMSVLPTAIFLSERRDTAAIHVITGCLQTEEVFDFYRDSTQEVFNKNVKQIYPILLYTIRFSSYMTD